MATATTETLFGCRSLHQDTFMLDIQAHVTWRLIQAHVTWRLFITSFLIKVIVTLCHGEGRLKRPDEILQQKATVRFESGARCRRRCDSSGSSRSCAVKRCNAVVSDSAGTLFLLTRFHCCQRHVRLFRFVQEITTTGVMYHRICAFLQTSVVTLFRMKNALPRIIHNT